MSTTIRDVAEKAKVSVATVSHVINGTRKVAPKTTERILRAMKELNYHPNAVARSLRTRSTKVIGVLVSDITNPFFASVVRGAEDAALEAGYSLIVCNSDESADREARYIRLFQRRRVDGILISPVGDGATDAVSQLRAEDMPMVFVDRCPADWEADAVLSDNVEGARLATLHLARAGHTRIGLILGIEGATTTEERLAGYRQGLEEMNLAFCEDLVRYGGYRMDGGRAAMNSLFLLEQPPSAVFSTNNLMTIGVFQELLRRGVKIPGEMALIAFDDLVWAEMVQPRLTVVSQRPEEIGHEAVRLLLERLSVPGRRNRRIIRIPVELRVRESA